jgi:hypothetical protein
MQLKLLIAALLAAAPAQVQAADDLTPLSDEFNDGTLAPAWTRFDAAGGWPDKLKVIDVGVTTPGALHIEPYHSAWVRDLNAPFLYKTLSGDFDVRARLRVRGRKGPVPGGTWSLGGLMARVPNGLDATWKPRAENWHFITTGVGHEPGKVMIETKGTYNSYSSLKLRPAPSGWIELRLVRVGMALFALARPEGGEWQIRDRFYRMEFDPTIEVGLIAYTTSDDVAPRPENPVAINRELLRDARVDMQMDVDRIVFARPRVSTDPNWYAQVSGSNRLTDPALADAEILAALGS